MPSFVSCIMDYVTILNRMQQRNVKLLCKEKVFALIWELFLLVDRRTRLAKYVTIFWIFYIYYQNSICKILYFRFFQHYIILGISRKDKIHDLKYDCISTVILCTAKNWTYTNKGSLKPLNPIKYCNENRMKKVNLEDYPTPDTF